MQKISQIRSAKQEKVTDLSRAEDEPEELGVEEEDRGGDDPGNQ